MWNNKFNFSFYLSLKMLLPIILSPHPLTHIAQRMSEQNIYMEIADQAFSLLWFTYQIWWMHSSKCKDVSALEQVFLLLNNPVAKNSLVKLFALDKTVPLELPQENDGKYLRKTSRLQLHLENWPESQSSKDQIILSIPFGYTGFLRAFLLV